MSIEFDSERNTNADARSLATFFLEEPDDLDGSLYLAHRLRNAIPCGQQYVLRDQVSTCKADFITVDDETKAEFEEMQKKGVLGSGSTQTAQQIQNFDLASWMAGKTDTGNRGENPVAQQPQQSKKRG